MDFYIGRNAQNVKRAAVILWRFFFVVSNFFLFSYCLTFIDHVYHIRRTA